MAAARTIFTKCLATKIENLSRIKPICIKKFNYSPQLTSVRSVGDKSSPEHPHEGNYSYDITSNPEEWKYVLRVLPSRTIPEPKPLTTYPSGWRPVSDKALEHPYFVDRSKNHMLSVYLQVLNMGQLKITQVKKIRGDIWLLHDELKQHIEEQVGKRIASYVQESNAVIRFRGDYVYYVEQWLLKKGF